MAKFKVGDRVRRLTDGFKDVHKGGIYTVTATCGGWLDMNGSEGQPYHEDQFELYIEDSPYPVGTTLICTQANSRFSLGQEYTIIAYQKSHIHQPYKISSDAPRSISFWISSNLEDIEDIVSEFREQPAGIAKFKVKSIDEVLSNTDLILAVSQDKPLQYKHNGKWVDVKQPLTINMYQILNTQFRIKKIIPISIQICKPLTRCEVSTDVLYTFAEGLSGVIAVSAKSVVDHRLFWINKSDAQQALDAIKRA